MTAVVKTPVTFFFFCNSLEELFAEYMFSSCLELSACGNRGQPLSSILVSKSFMVYSGEMPPILKLSDVVSQ